MQLANQILPPKVNTFHFSNNPTNRPHVFHVQTTWIRSFPRRFNMNKRGLFVGNLIWDDAEIFTGNSLDRKKMINDVIRVVT